MFGVSLGSGSRKLKIKSPLFGKNFYVKGSLDYLEKVLDDHNLELEDMELREGILSGSSSVRLTCKEKIPGTIRSYVKRHVREVEKGFRKGIKAGKPLTRYVTESGENLTHDGFRYVDGRLVGKGIEHIKSGMYMGEITECLPDSVVLSEGYKLRKEGWGSYRVMNSINRGHARSA